MKTKWLLQQGRSKLLLFVNGWGMDEHPFQPLTSDVFDVFMLYDYQDLALDVDLKAIAQPYQEVHLLAWSLGVWICQQLREQLPERTAFSMAVNGTLQPVHQRYGIAPGIFDSTLKNLSARTLHSFYENMFLDEAHAKLFFAHSPQRPIPEIIRELEHLRGFILADADPQEVMGFDVALIGNHDIIMPAKSQLRFWQNQSTCRLETTGHFPFYRWSRWEDVFVYHSHE